MVSQHVVISQDVLGSLKPNSRYLPLVGRDLALRDNKITLITGIGSGRSAAFDVTYVGRVIVTSNGEDLELAHEGIADYVLSIRSNPLQKGALTLQRVNGPDALEFRCNVDLTTCRGPRHFYSLNDGIDTLHIGLAQPTVVGLQRNLYKATLNLHCYGYTHWI